MSGVVTPPVIVEPFGTGAADPAYITLPIPVDSQIGVIDGAASFTDGFPPLTMSDPETEGGVPPFGQDMNGILYMVTAFCAMLQAGQKVPYDIDASTAFFGYAIGAQVASVATPGRVWTNYVDGNTNDPDAVDTGWAASDPLYPAPIAPAAGTYDDVVLPGASDYAIDIDTTAGDVIETGFIAQRNGQRLIRTNTGPNNYTIDTLTGSAATNQVRGIPGGITLVQYQTVTLEYVATLDKWLFV